AMDGVLRNLPTRPAAWLVRPLIFPLGRRAHGVKDSVSTTIAQLLQSPNATRDRLTETCYVPTDREGLGLLSAAMGKIIDCQELEKQLLKAVREGTITS